MSKIFEVIINCDNDAFSEDCDSEVAGILRVVANQVAAGEYALPSGRRTFTQILRDSNGNEVGLATYRIPLRAAKRTKPQ